MPRGLSQIEFVERANFLHDNKYDYSQTRYLNAKCHVTVICPVHGPFSIQAGRHIRIRIERGETKAQGCQQCWQEEARWSEEDLELIAKRFSRRVEFQRQEKGAYLSAMRKGLLDKICTHMESTSVPSGHWQVMENCRKEAAKYATRSDFMRQSGSAYNSSLSNGWLDEICQHMVKGADGYHYMVYAIINKRLNKAYVGITKQHFEQRMRMHKKGGSTTAREITDLSDTIYIPCTDYIFDSTEVKSAEIKWAQAHAQEGYQILNSSRMYGKIGTKKRIYTDEIIAQEASKYTTRSEFKKNSPRHYDAAVTQRILNKVCSHMRSIKRKNHWTFERCLEFAKTCGSRVEFHSARNGSYTAARKNRWLEEIYRISGLKSVKDMPWMSSKSRVEVWSKADEYYTAWVENGKCSNFKMKNLTGLNLDKLLKKFNEGWVPQMDRDWQQWSVQVRQEKDI